MSEFVRFPRTPHLLWLGPGAPRDDKLLSPAEAGELLSHPVIIEEKLDGTNLGLSIGEDGELRVQNRGSYVPVESPHPQFKPLRRWLSVRRQSLVQTLGRDLIVFGEWCHARHTVPYTRLPDWFVAFDIFDRTAGRFWSAERRDRIVAGIGLAVVPRLAEGRFDLRSVQGLLGGSRVGDGPAEGIYVRRDHGGFLQGRAKLVRPEFTLAIGEHWQRRRLTPNRIAGGHAASVDVP
ncbi:MAG: RNA ligase family protein [Acidobacteria bacterium]|nr:RNA ligase family protein [Acidobacteriota bacterium]